VIKFKYGEGVYGHHVAVIKGFTGEGFYVQEYNVNEDGKFNDRVVPYDDPHIVGFWSEENGIIEEQEAP
jgi:hypothetical protein